MGLFILMKCLPSESRGYPQNICQRKLRGTYTTPSYEEENKRSWVDSNPLPLKHNKTKPEKHKEEKNKQTITDGPEEISTVYSLGWRGVRLCILTPLR